MMTHMRHGRGPEPPDAQTGPVGLLARLFLTQLLVVLAVAAVITSVFALAGIDDDAENTSGPGGRPEATVSAPATSATAAPTSAEPVTPTPSPPPASSRAEPVTPKVDVLNQSAGSNAAQNMADRLRARGWRIGRVDDFSGTIQMTTVYYPPGLTAEAQDVAADMPGVPRVAERFSPLSTKRVTVILVD